MNCSQLRGRLEYATGGNEGRWREKMFETAATCRAKHRLQPCEPKPRHAEARRYSPRRLRHENNTAPTEAKLANLNQRALFLNKANAACGVASPAKAEAASLRAGRLSLAQLCELQNRRTTKTAIEQPSANNYSLSILLRHYAASGLLNLLTTLAQAVACTTPGTPTAFRGKPYGRTNYRR